MPSARYKAPQAMGVLLAKQLDKWDLTGSLRRYEVFAAWPQLVGEKIAGQSKALRLRGNALVIEVEHPAWLNELKMLRPTILRKIRKLYPQSEIKDLEFFLK